MSHPHYQLEGIRHSYGDGWQLALDHLNIERGAIVAIVGPSGAGKSTLLRLLGFLERPLAGKIAFAGRWLDDAPSLAVRRQVTMVFQRPYLLSRSVAANVEYGLSLRGERPSPEIVHEWLDRLGLASLARRPAGKLSAGEAQRVALARALAVRPPVLLLDEPTANLDPYNVGLIEEVVRQENERRGTTIVMVTHNVFQARRLAGRVALLWQGRLVEVGETGAFFERPQDPRTAAFVRGELVY
ncbi:MAG: phosphate ABC transporter ATP-binding protein [Chloroflexota bacterium]